MITDYDAGVDNSEVLDKKTCLSLLKKDEKRLCRKRNRKNPTTLLKQPAMKPGCLDEKFVSK